MWEEVPSKTSTNNKPSNNSKGNTSTTKPQQQQQSNQQQSQKAKPKSKKEETNVSKNGGTNPVDEFTNWCTKALSNISSEIDSMHSFILFLFMSVLKFLENRTNLERNFFSSSGMHIEMHLEICTNLITHYFFCLFV